MKYFRPELYVQLNSPDEALADAAEEAIERANDAYCQRWRQIQPHLSPSVVRFGEQHCLHDADVFAPARLADPTPTASPGDVVIVTQNVNTLYPEHLNTLIFLYYAGAEEPTITTPVISDVFNAVQPHWLYDEFDVIEPGVFSHSILISDGRVVTIHFREFRYHVARIISPAALASAGTASLTGAPSTRSA